FFFQAEDGIRDFHVTGVQTCALPIFRAAEKELEFLEKNNLTVYFYQDHNYPEKLKHCPDSPVLLFGSGNMNFNNMKVLSIVGTRNITSYGTSFCKKLIEDLVVFNPI